MFNTLISVDELNNNLKSPNWVIVDCRFSLADKESGRRDYQSAHIPSATYAHLDEDLSGPIIPGKTGRHPLPSVKKAATLFSSWGIGNDTQVVAYDQGHGGIAARLWWMLRWLGHEKVAVLNGGWAAWQKAGLTTNEEVPSASPRLFSPAPRIDLVIPLEVIAANIKNKAFKLIDSRAAERYRGEKEPIDPVAGHIPTAINAPFIENVDAGGKFRSKEELRARFAGLLDQQPAEESIFYCGSGVTACHNLLALQYAGMGEGKLYPGSWSEWIVDPDRGVERDLP